MLFKKKAIVYSLLVASVLISCVSTQTYNAKLNTPKPVKALRTDVDFVQHKLEKLHPDLYLYIPKAALDAKFDSLRASITSPMTSREFFMALSPVVAAVRQGHTQLQPALPRLTKEEKKKDKQSGSSPLTQFDYELFGSKLMIIKNNSKDSSIHIGTEVISVNGVRTQDLLSKYARTFTSDGYNTTFKTRRLARNFPRYFYFENGLTDSVKCELAYRDSLRTLMLRRPAKDTKLAQAKKKEPLKKNKPSQPGNKKQPSKTISTSNKSKQLDFYPSDSSIAVMKITNFSQGIYRKFYRKSFEKLDSLHTPNLVIDLRDNPGGMIADVRTLYAYLADTSFHFIEKPAVVSKTSLWSASTNSNKSLWLLPVRIIATPFILVGDVYSYLATTKDSNQIYRFPMRAARLQKTNSHRFRGKVYVLINGGSFSASCLLSSNLKGSGRAVFVGTETGGAFNGCVAGFMPIFTLPHSKLSLRVGLMECKSPYKTTPDGHGILPDKKVVPTIEDRINKTDPEMKEIVREIKQQQAQTHAKTDQ